MKSRLTSCLLLIANNLLNQVICTRILTIYFSSVFDSYEERKPLQEKDFLSDYVSCLIYNCPYWVQSFFDSQ